MWNSIIQRFLHQQPPLFTALVIVVILANLNTARARADIQSIQYFLKKFNVSRNAEYSKSEARGFIKKTLEEQGYKTWLEYFNTEGYTGYNVVARKSGSFKNSHDRIFIVGAHFDTYKKSPGVDDNGSGLAAMLQVARKYSDKDMDCDQNYTIVFVAFDQRECKICRPEDRYEDSCRCSYGSKAFIKNFTKHLGQNFERGKIQGAVIMESIMNFDPSINAQNFSEEVRKLVDKRVTDVVEKIEKGGNRGDFILAVGRDDGDKHLLGNFSKYYYQGKHYSSKFKLQQFTWTLQERPSVLISTARNNLRYLFAGDHYRFWDNDPMVKTIYLTDTADFRGYMKYCYHNDCDDFSHVTKDRLEFVGNIADTVYDMARHLTGLDLDQCTRTLYGNVTLTFDSSSSGVIESPGYPNHYPNNADSVWYIKLPSNPDGQNAIELKFDDFQLENGECTSDYVEVYDGNNPEKLKGHYCGTKPSGFKIKVPGRSMTVKFRSDSLDTFKGFKARWSEGTTLHSTSFSLLYILAIVVYLWT